MATTTKKRKTDDDDQNGTRSWSELPEELLEAIAAGLGTRKQICEFRAVCKRWQQSARFSVLPPKPLLNPLLPHDTSPFYDRSHSRIGGESPVLVATSVCLLRPVSDPTQRPWLLTVEELNLGKLYFKHPLSRVACEYCEGMPRVMNLSEYEITELNKGYCFRFRDMLGGMFDRFAKNNYCGISKVVLFSNPACGTNPSIDDCTAFVLLEKGHLLALSLKSKKLSEAESCVHFSSPDRVVFRFDDVVVFQDKIYVIDRRGRVYAISYGSSRMKTIVTEPISKGSGSDWKKCLAESLGCLYMVQRFSDGDSNRRFQVHKLDVRGRMWVKVKRFGKSRVLFVSGDGCFFASVKDLLLGCGGNSILFCKGSFSDYNSNSGIRTFVNWRKKDYPDVAVVVGRNDRYGLPLHISIYPSYSKLFWPLPAWLPSVTCSSEGYSEESDQATEESEENEQDSPDAEHTQDTSDSEASNSSLKHESEGRSSKSPFSSLPSEAMALDQEIYNQEHAPETLETETHLEKLSHLSSQLEVQEQCTLIPAHIPTYGHPVVEAEILDETNNDKTSQSSWTEFAAFRKKFSGADIRPDTIPILEKIWAKHGDIIEGTTVRNAGTVARALESLAEVVKILQGSSARCLSDSQVEFLSTALFDLQHMGFKVDWLVSSVEKALSVLKNKPLIDSLMEIERDKTKAEERKVQLLDELAKVDEEERVLEEKRILLREKLSISGLNDDLDQCLGDGLW